jgi:type VI secretion system protein ImpK
MADLVGPIFRQGLRIKERLRRGEKLNFAAEQAVLKQLFKMPTPVDLPDTAFLGARYPVACWLDEVFIEEKDSPWRQEWNENKIEFAQFHRALRFDLFWDQATLAEGEGNIDALEVFYLCVMLGFRGRLRDDHKRLLDWRESVEHMIGQGRATEWPEKPPEVPLPPTDVPPLRGGERLRWLLLSYSVIVGLAVFLTVIYLFQHN